MPGWPWEGLALTQGHGETGFPHTPARGRVWEGAALPGMIPLLIADFGLWIAPQGVTVRSGTPTNAESSTGNGMISSVCGASRMEG